MLNEFVQNGLTYDKCDYRYLISGAQRLAAALDVQAF
jgi:hypothetical protein